MRLRCGLPLFFLFVAGVGGSAICAKSHHKHEKDQGAKAPAVATKSRRTKGMGRFSGVITWVLVRHGDKLMGDDDQKVETGPYLSAQGISRSFALARYMLTEDDDRGFKCPDMIFAQGPAQDKNGSSLRPLQTVLPLANILQERDESQVFAVNRQFGSTESAALGTYVYNHPEVYSDKTILVCWEHEYLPTVAYMLGLPHADYEAALQGQERPFDAGAFRTWQREVKKKAGYAKAKKLWASNDFDSVYTLKTDDMGNYVDGSFQILSNCYPIDDYPMTWDEYGALPRQTVSRTQPVSARQQRLAQRAAGASTHRSTRGRTRLA